MVAQIPRLLVGHLLVGAALGAACTSGDAADVDASTLDNIDATGRADAAEDARALGDAPNDAATGDGATTPTDAGPDVAVPLPCTRAAEARTAPVSLYDTFAQDMLTLTGAARASRVDTFLADVKRAGGTPLHGSTSRSVFLAAGTPPDGTQWKVVGSFVAWDLAQALPMVQVTGTDLWVLDTTRLVTSETYKLFSGTDTAGLFEDPLARTITWDGVVRGGPIDFNAGRFHAIAHPEKLPSTKGRLTRHDPVNATQLGNSRSVYVYLPPKYDDGTCTPLPSIVFNDGNETLTRGDYAGAADALYAASPALSAVLVFAELASPVLQQRIDEYSFGFGGSKGAQYVDFVARDLGPRMRAEYRLCSKPEARGFAGASLGGLVASYGAFERPNEWGWVGAQSASFWWNGSALTTRASATNPNVPTRFYLDSSCPNDNCTEVDAFASVLLSKGYDHQRIKVNVAAQPPDPHDWSFFKTRAAQLLTHFRAGQTVCN
jgi:hypothetical protein